MSQVKTAKQLIVDRLLENKEITKHEALELLRDQFAIPQYPYMPTNPVPFPANQKLINDDLERRAARIAACGCNPANGGSGICGCILSQISITS